MSDLLNNILDTANDPFKAGTNLVRDKFFGDSNSKGGAFSDGTNTNFKEFRTAIFEDGLQRTNKFLLNITFPNKSQEIITEGKIDSRKLSLKCITCDIPTKNVVLKDMPANGQPYKLGENHEFGEFNAAFILSEKHTELRTFNNWMNLIYNAKKGTSGFYRDYVSPRIEIYPLNARDNQNYVYILEDCFPIALDTSNMSNEENDGFSTLAVSFAFRRFLSSNQEINALPEEEIGTLGELASGLKTESKLIGAVDNGFSKLESFKNKFK